MRNRLPSGWRNRLEISNEKLIVKHLLKDSGNNAGKVQTCLVGEAGIGLIGR